MGKPKVFALVEVVDVCETGSCDASHFEDCLRSAGVRGCIDVFVPAYLRELVPDLRDACVEMSRK